MKKSVIEYAADFETNTSAEGCCANPVWAWGVAPVGANTDDMFEYCTSIESFMRWAFDHPGRYWFHNAGFDTKFIISWLLINGYKHTEKREPGAGEFTLLMDSLGKFYHMQITNECSTFEIADSYKKLPMSLENVAGAYGLEMTKGEIDYNAYREPGHILTELELDYLRRDVLILAKALDHRFELGEKLTTGADCLAALKDLFGKRQWRVQFPELDPELDSILRKAYRGGYVYANPLHVNKHLGEGGRIDVNSLYPFVMHDRCLPVGKPLLHAGKPVKSETYPLWISEITFSAHLKNAKLPCIQVKGSLFFNAREYQTDIDEPITMMLTNVDWALINECYTVDVISYGDTYYFRGVTGLFKEYVDAGMVGKMNAKSPGERMNWKLWLNNAYGKYAQKIKVRGKVPRLDSDGIVHYVMGDETERKPVYLPVGIFVTAWARDYTIRTALKFGDRFIYSDTDSIHFIGSEIPKDILIDSKKLGYWDLEAAFSDCVCLRAKTYAEAEYSHDKNGNLIVRPWAYTCAGMVEPLKQIMRIEDFHPGFTTDFEKCEGVPEIYRDKSKWKIVPQAVKGGVILVPRPFTIR